MNFSHNFRVLTAIAAVTLAPIAAHALSISGNNIVLTEDSTVLVTFEGYSAAYTSDLALALPVNGLGVLFTNQTASVGSTVLLGNFAAGTELVFSLFVRNDNVTYFTGLATANPDGVVHAKIALTLDGNKANVGFEDLRGGGDKDFNDFLFSVTAQPVPDSAATVGLLALGLAALAVARRRLS